MVFSCQNNMEENANIQEKADKERTAIKDNFEIPHNTFCCFGTVK